MEEDDPVVQELDVYLSQALAKNLCGCRLGPGRRRRLTRPRPRPSRLLPPSYLVQYPQRSRDRPIEVPSVAKLRPKHQILELEFPIEQGNGHFDADVHDPRYIERLRMESSTFKPAVQYAVAVVADGGCPCERCDPARGAVTPAPPGALHLTPVRGVFQMRPDFSHLDGHDNAGACEACACRGDFVALTRARRGVARRRRRFLGRRGGAAAAQTRGGVGRRAGAACRFRSRRARGA